MPGEIITPSSAAPPDARSPPGSAEDAAATVLAEAGGANTELLVRMPAALATSSRPRASTIGASGPRPELTSTAAACGGRAARGWAARRRSTAWSTCAATRAITTNGGSSASPAGRG
ncbi:hypothetical protein AB5I41_02905 [Sphingomonas sp. MMS24-JH45]